jgi:stage V sporulation protein G
VDITEVRISLNMGGKVKAFAQVVLDSCFLVGDIRILEGKEGTVHVTMPSRRLRSGSYRDIAHPLNSETRHEMEEAILGEYQRVIEERGLVDGAGGDGTPAQQISGRLLSEKYWTNEDPDDE